jgi:hypothetical protein
LRQRAAFSGWIPQLGGDLLILQSIGGPQYDARPFDDTRWQRPRPGLPLQGSTLFGVQCDRAGYSHSSSSSL